MPHYFAIGLWTNGYLDCWTGDCSHLPLRLRIDRLHPGFCAPMQTIILFQPGSDEPCSIGRVERLRKITSGFIIYFGMSAIWILRQQRHGFISPR